MGEPALLSSRVGQLRPKNIEDASDSWASATLGGAVDFFTAELIGSSRESVPRLVLMMTGKYPSRNDVDRWHAMSQRPVRQVRAEVRRALGSKDSKTVSLVSEPKVIDVSRFAVAHKTSGIPRVMRGLISSVAADDYVLAVWDRGALAPVELDDRGGVLFPKKYWRSTPRLSAAVRVLLAIRVTRWGSALLFPFERLGILKALGEWFVRWSTNPGRRTRARVNINLTDTRLVIGEIPQREDSQRIVEWLASGKSTDVVVFVHDLLPLSHLQYFDQSSSMAHLELLNVLKLATQVVTSSTILRDQVKQTLEGLHGVDIPVSVAELPVSTGFTLSSPRLPQNYFCFVGGFEKRKGLDVTLTAWRSLENGDQRLKVVGSPSPLKPDEMPLFLSARKVHGVEVLGAVSDARLIEAMANAGAAIYLSTAEGYGLPILEALRLGVPVVCADTPTNRYFSRQYGGIRLVPLRGSSADPEVLAGVFEDWSELLRLRQEIDRSRIPCDVETWARNVLEGGPS
jgi:glycosyltransferase involved in cell wall biosynthesis